MSFYSMLFGKNPGTEVILALIGFKEHDVERFRDCWIDYEEKEIGVYTRTGGGNREDYPQELLYQSPYFKTTFDDDYDTTYATFVFRFPEEIEADILALTDIPTNGISGKLIQWIMKTSSRPATDVDKRNAQYESQKQLIAELQRTGHCSEAFNGHTVVPLSDRGMERIMKATEETEGELLPYWCAVPLKLDVKINSPRWNFDNKNPDLEQDKYRVLVDLPKDWPIDFEVWDRWKAKFGEKYPKSVAVIDEYVERRRK